MERETAMKILKELHDNSLFSNRIALETLIPELADSNDERIRKALLEMVHDTTGDELRVDYNVHKEEALAWLEKQVSVEHFELKKGHWYMCHRAYCCRADNLTIKEGERFQCEKDGIVKGFVIKEPEKYFIEVHNSASMEDDQNDDVRRRSTIQVLEYARSLDTYNQYGKADIDKNIAWLEKQGEQRKQLINKACDVLVNCIEDFMTRRMEVWDEECKKQTLENIRKTLEE